MAATQEYASNMTSAGQLILPQEVRRALGLKSQGKVVFRVTDEKVEVLSESAAKESTPSTAQQVLSSLPAFALETLVAMGEAILEGGDEAKPTEKPKAKPKAKAKAKPKATAKAKPKAKPKAASKPRAEPKATAKPKAEPKAAAKPKKATASKPKTTAKPKSTAKTKAAA